MDLELVVQEPGPKRDELWDALMGACGIDDKTITRSARGAYNNSLAQLRRVRATPRDVSERAKVYGVRFPHAALTPSALCRHWAELRPRKLGVSCPEHGGEAGCYFMAGTGWSHGS